MSSLFRKNAKAGGGGGVMTTRKKRTRPPGDIDVEKKVDDDVYDDDDEGSPPPPSQLRRSDAGGGGREFSSSSYTSSLTTFADLGLMSPLVSTCRKLGFVSPTPVQRAVIPRILRMPSSHLGAGGVGVGGGKEEGGRGGVGVGGGHLLVLSATGSGKTAAFALPLLQILSSDPYGIFGLILTPTRELAKQITQQVLAIGRGSGMRVTCALIVGGEDVTRQNLELDRRPNFVVATPGRLAELCRAGSACDDGFIGGGGMTGGVTSSSSSSSSSSYDYYGPNLTKVKFVVLDEADRLLCARSGFERDVAEILLRSTTTTAAAASSATDIGDGGGGVPRRTRREGCRTLLFSATMTRSLASLEGMAGGGVGRLPLEKVVIREDGTWDDGSGDGEMSRGTKEREKGAKKKKKKKKGTLAKKDESDNGDDGNSDDSNSDDDSYDDVNDGGGSTPNIPAGLRQEYVFMPDRVREAYLMCVIRTLMTNGGRGNRGGGNVAGSSSGWNDAAGNVDDHDDHDDDDGNGRPRRHPLARSAIVFAPTCERCAHISGILTELGVHNVALHSLLSQNRRLASLGMFQSQRVRVLVATDVASRGLDVPEVDLVINVELPRRAVDYVHRVGRTARAGRRGRAVSLVGESDVDLVHEAEKISGRSLEKCVEITDEMAVRLLGPVAKASRLTRMKLMDIGFDELVAKHRERKRKDRRRREKAESRARKAAALASERSRK
ncbi:hypothetical protein ACHAXA_000859 [Cyclostephanos tholiformis]|uniref:RNA helicase n=1 Tax=Cyclostephanos tholiformis TaxID=382380 RepID=A0ABD3SR94_9STRA